MQQQSPSRWIQTCCGSRTASLEKFLLISNAFLCFSSSLNAELIIPATGNVFYAMTSSSVDFLLRRKGGNTPLGSQPISTETSATFPRIKAKGRRLVRTLFWNQPGFRWSAVIFFWRECRWSSHRQYMWPSLCKTKIYTCLFFFSCSCKARSTKTPRPSPHCVLIHNSIAGSVKHFRPPAALLCSPEPSAVFLFSKQYALLIYTNGRATETFNWVLFGAGSRVPVR